MKVVQFIIMMIIIVGMSDFAHSMIYNYKISDTEEVDVGKFIEEFSVINLTDMEIEEINRKKAEEELEIHKENERERIKSLVSRGSNRGTFTATAYDLTVASCGKKASHPLYGITANGTSLKGETLESARAIAVDPKVIKLGSKVYIEFLDEEYRHLDGIFTAVDTGGAIKGKKIDIFFGDTGDSKTSQSVWDFGRRKAKLIVLPIE